MEISSQNPPKNYAWSALVGAVIVGFVGFAAYGIARKTNAPAVSSSNSTPNITRSDIVNQFEPPANTAPAPANLTPRQSAPAATSPSTAPTPKVYTNKALGFSMDLPIGATVKVTTNQVTAQNKTAYWQVAIYDNTGATLNDIQDQLAHSPQVSQISRVSFGSEVMLKYWDAKVGTSYVAIHNGRLYYITGSGNLADSFRFL